MWYSAGGALIIRSHKARVEKKEPLKKFVHFVLIRQCYSDEIILFSLMDLMDLDIFRQTDWVWHHI